MYDNHHGACDHRLRVFGIDPPTEQPLQAECAAQIAVATNQRPHRVEVEQQEPDTDREITEHEDDRGVVGPQPHRAHRQWIQEGPGSAVARSEEHTSELQSLMRISYAVFCLKKKKTEK